MALGKGLSSLIPQQNRARKVIRKETGLVDTHSDKIWHIPLSDIIANTHQPRREFDHTELENLVTSIKTHGILQPLVVTEHIDGGYELIAGERRLRAAQIAGFSTVPALVRSVTTQEKLELALIENIQRQQLNAIEEAFAFARLIEEFNLTQEEVALRVGKSRPQIANTVRLLDLPDEMQKALVDGHISVGKARAILSLKSEKEQMALFKSMIGQEMSVRDVEQLVARKGDMSRKGSIRRDPNIRAQEEMLENRLGSKVHISQRGEKGTLTIVYSSKEELKRIISEIVSS